MRTPLCRNVIGSVVAVALGLAGCSARGQDTTKPPISEIGTTPTAPTTPPAPPSTRDHNGSALPPMKHFRIGDDVYGPVHDCRVSDDAVTCTLSWEKPYSVESYTGTVTGTLSGFTMKGTSTIHQTYRDETDPNCLWDQDVSGPVTYIFSLDGTVAMRGDRLTSERLAAAVVQVLIPARVINGKVPPSGR